MRHDMILRTAISISMLQLSRAQRAPCPCHSSKLGASYVAPLAFQEFPRKAECRGHAAMPKSHPPFSTSMNGKKKRNWFEFLEVLISHGFGPHLPTACKRLATWEGWYLLVDPCDKFQWKGASPEGSKGSTRLSVIMAPFGCFKNPAKKVRHSLSFPADLMAAIRTWQRLLKSDHGSFKISGFQKILQKIWLH